MNHFSHRILVINWKWGKYFDIPRFSCIKGDKWEILMDELSEKITAYTVVQETDDSDQLPDFSSDNVKDFVIPICVEFETTESSFEEKQELIEKLISSIREKVTKNNPASYLFMQHKGVGFDHGDHWEEIIKKQHQHPFRFATFGGAIGPMYEKQGLLHAGLPNFQVAGKHTSVWFDKKNKQVLAIKKNHFDYIWEYFCYSTRQYLEEMFKEMEYLGGPLMTTVQHQQIQEGVQNLYYHSQAQYDTMKPTQNGVPVRWDFKNCLDLPKLISHPDFEPHKEEWFGSLHDFGLGKTQDPAQLIDCTRKLIQTWKNN
ncbi:MAG: hypothetical protein KDD99_17510 [Bacteroidetes bacterium]|nr:hypothetical protein [Bacteroidota bacterium]